METLPEETDSQEQDIDLGDEFEEEVNMIEQGDDYEEPEKKEPEEKEPVEDEPEEKTNKFLDMMNKAKEAARNFIPSKKEPEPEKAPVAEDKPDNRITKEKVKEFISSIDPESLPGEMTINDLEINLREMAQDEPEMFALISTVVNESNQKTISALNKLSAEMEELRAWKSSREEMDALRAEGDKYWTELEKVHPGAWENYVKDPVKTKELSDWILSLGKEESESLQKLAYESTNPNDGILVLNLFKEAKAANDAKNHDNKLTEKKEKTDAILKESPPKRQISKPSADSDDVDLKDEFEDEVKKIEKEQGTAKARI